jgi:sulfur transfer protein SufE
VLEIIGPHLVLRSDKNIENKEREKQDIRNKLEFYKMKGDYYRYMCEISKDLEYLHVLFLD